MTNEEMAKLAAMTLEEALKADARYVEARINLLEFKKECLVELRWNTDRDEPNGFFKQMKSNRLKSKLQRIQSEVEHSWSNARKQFGRL